MFKIYLTIVLIIEIFYPLLQDSIFGSSGSKVTGIDLILLVLTFLAIFKILYKTKIVNRLRSKQTTLLLWLICISIISLISGILIYGSSAIGEYRLILYSLFYFLTILFLDNFEKIKKLLIGILLGTVILVIQSVLQLLNLTIGPSAGEFNYFSHLIRGDAVLLISFLPLYLLSFSGSKSIKHKKLVKICTIFWLLIILLSQVRSVVVTIGVAFIIYILFILNLKYKIKYVTISLLTLGVIIVVYIIFTPPQVLESNIIRYSGLIDTKNDVNDTFRIIAAETAINQISSNPIIGVPFGTYMNFKVYGIFYDRFDPHNSYLYLGARVGILGLALFIIIIFITNIEAIKTIKFQDLSSPIKNLYIAFTLFFISLSVFITFNASLKNDSAGIFFWIILGAMVSINNLLKEADYNVSELQ